MGPCSRPPNCTQVFQDLLDHLGVGVQLAQGLLDVVLLGLKGTFLLGPLVLASVLPCVRGLGLASVSASAERDLLHQNLCSPVKLGLCGSWIWIWVSGSRLCLQISIKC